MIEAANRRAVTRTCQGPSRGAYASASRARYEGVAPPGPTRNVFLGRRRDRIAIHVETTVTITVDRGMREVLRNCLRSEAYQLEHFEGVISGADEEAAHEALAHASHIVEMFDQLGWADDDPRERYEITVALDSFVPRLEGYKDDLAESLTDEMMFLRATAAGDEAHDWGGRNQPEMIAITHDEVLGWRTELAVIEALLERLGSSGAGAG
jgi:hypothetical protein